MTLAAEVFALEVSSIGVANKMRSAGGPEGDLENDEWVSGASEPIAGSQKEGARLREQLTGCRLVRGSGPMVDLEINGELRALQRRILK